VEFFNKESGATPKFNIQNDEVVGFTSGSIVGVRLDDGVSVD
jgi:hypothetical protein